MKLTKTHLILIAIFLIAFILRSISAYYAPIGSDEIIYSLIPLNIIHAERLSTVEQAPLYFYLTDIGYKLTGGLTLATARLTATFFGAAAIFIIFLITQELFHNKKISYLSSFLFALSGYAFQNNQEMDMTSFFFALLSTYFFLKVLQGKYKQLYFATFFLALAALAKPIILLMLIPYTILLVYHFQHHRTSEEQPPKIQPQNIKHLAKIIILSAILFLITVSPVLVYNYLLNKEKNITDYYFSTIAGIGTNQIYAGQQGHGWSINNLFHISKIIFSSILRFDFLILILGIIGLFLAYKKEKHATLLYLTSILFLILYLAGRTGSTTHYLWIPLVLSIYAGFTLYHINQYLQEHFQFKYLIIIILLIATLNSIWLVTQIIPQRDTSISVVLNDYSRKNIPQNAIVVLDPRIYRGIYAWSFNDKHYLEGTYFPQFTEKLNQFSGPKQDIPLYYIQCAPGTYCGWKPEDYQRISPFAEKLTAELIPQMQKKDELHAIDNFIIYQGTLTASQSIYEPIDRTHNHWYTPVAWQYPDQAIDNYTPRGFVDTTLNALAFLVLYLDVLIALLSPLFVLYLISKTSAHQENSSP